MRPQNMLLRSRHHLSLRYCTRSRTSSNLCLLVTSSPISTSIPTRTSILLACCSLFTSSITQQSATLRAWLYQVSTFHSRRHSGPHHQSSYCSAKEGASITQKKFLASSGMESFMEDGRLMIHLPLTRDSNPRRSKSSQLQSCRLTRMLPVVHLHDRTLTPTSRLCLHFGPAAQIRIHM